ncbi:hypothetical protein AC579_7174 [Pseudocercospora musae]|uniref:Uncharacterized protein n=1 Tax=Pseudocercospora musae TaxID=113226 RepID=A0A139I892_9PEZI|nr:hypothetical protein AC579_7174 [Pseudocercospora musae]
MHDVCGCALTEGSDFHLLITELQRACKDLRISSADNRAILQLRIIKTSSTCCAACLLVSRRILRLFRKESDMFLCNGPYNDGTLLYARSQATWRARDTGQGKYPLPLSDWDSQAEQGPSEKAIKDHLKTWNLRRNATRRQPQDDQPSGQLNVGQQQEPEWEADLSWRTSWRSQSSSGTESCPSTVGLTTHHAHSPSPAPAMSGAVEPYDRERQRTMSLICNWYDCFVEQTAGIPVASAGWGSTEVFWDIHDALPLAMQGCQIGWDTLRTIGSKRRVLPMMQDPRSFIILLHRVTWLYEFPKLMDPELSGDDIAGIPQFVRVVLTGLGEEANALYGGCDHPILLLLGMILRRELTPELCHCVFMATMTYLGSIYQPGDTASKTLQLQTLFGSALTMLQAYDYAENVLADVQDKAHASGDLENRLASCAALGIVRGFQGNFSDSKDLLSHVVVTARRGRLRGSDTHRYSICGTARLCKAMGQFEEAEKLYQEAVPLGQTGANPNLLYHINMVRHLHRLYVRRQNFEDAIQLERQYPKAFHMQYNPRRSRVQINHSRTVSHL